MNSSELYKILTDNRISVQKGFSNVLNEGCVGGYQSLMDGILSAIETGAKYGVNNGFNGGLKKHLSQLTVYAVEIAKHKNDKKYAKYSEKIKPIIGSLEENMKNKTIEENVAERLILYIEQNINGIRVLTEEDIAEDRKYILNACIKKMEMIVKTVSAVSVVSTERALDYSKRIIAEIKPVCDSIASLNHNETFPSKLDGAIKIAEEWKGLSVGLKKGSDKPLKKGVAENSILLGNEELQVIGMGMEVRMNLNNFKSNLADYKKRKEKLYDTTDLAKEIEEKRAEENDCTEKIKQLTVAYQNGGLSATDYVEQAKDLKAEIADIKTEMEDINKSITQKKHKISMAKRTFRKLKIISDTIEELRDQPFVLSYFGSKYDFNAINGLLLGAGSEEDVLKLATAQKEVANFSRRAESMIKDVMDRLERSNNTESERTVLTLNTEEEKAKAEQARKEAELLVAEFGAATVNVSSENSQETKNEGLVGLVDEDK